MNSDQDPRNGEYDMTNSEEEGSMNCKQYLCQNFCPHILFLCVALSILNNFKILIVSC